MTETFKEICWGISRGFRDAIMGSLKVFKMDREITKEEAKSPEQKSVLAKRRAAKQKPSKPAPNNPSESKVRNRILYCCTWNGGIFWFSIVIFNHVLLPVLQWLTGLLSGPMDTTGIWAWTGPMLSWTFNTFWILPVFVLSKIVNCFWFADIADAAYRKSRGRPQLPNISLFVADMLFSLLLQTFFLIQATLASFLPIPAISLVISVVHMSLLYSLYSFEYKWINMGWTIQRRLGHIEASWPYFFGFGLPMAIVTAYPESLIISGCVFAVFFPVFIISANEADDTSQASSVPMKLFAPVVSLTNLLFHHSLTKHQKTPSSQQGKAPTRRESPRLKAKENVTFR